MLKVDLCRDRFLKVWRVSGESVEATAAVIQRGGGYCASIHYQYPDGRHKTLVWRTRKGTLLTGRDVVLCINSIEKSFQHIPGTRLRVDFPPGATQEDQVLMLMEFGLLKALEEADTHIEGVELPLLDSETDKGDQEEMRPSRADGEDSGEDSTGRPFQS